MPRWAWPCLQAGRCQGVGRAGAVGGLPPGAEQRCQWRSPAAAAAAAAGRGAAAPTAAAATARAAASAAATAAAAGCRGWLQLALQWRCAGARRGPTVLGRAAGGSAAVARPLAGTAVGGCASGHAVCCGHRPGRHCLHPVRRSALPAGALAQPASAVLLTSPRTPHAFCSAPCPRRRFLQEHKWQRQQGLRHLPPWSPECEAHLAAACDRALAALCFAAIKPPGGTAQQPLQQQA